jgi:hypothetical protein
MRRLFLAVLGVFAVAGVASAQQPVYTQPGSYPTIAPGAVAATPVVPSGGATVIQGSGGCTSCGPTTRGYTMSKHSGGGDCMLGYGCQNGCGSLKSDAAFHFGSCKQFFSPCGPSCGNGGHGSGCGGLFGGKCGALPYAQPWGIGWQCPRQYDTNLNH